VAELFPGFPRHPCYAACSGAGGPRLASSLTVARGRLARSPFNCPRLKKKIGACEGLCRACFSRPTESICLRFAPGPRRERVPSIAACPNTRPKEASPRHGGVPAAQSKTSRHFCRSAAACAAAISPTGFYAVDGRVLRSRNGARPCLSSGESRLRQVQWAPDDLELFEPIHRRPVCFGCASVIELFFPVGFCAACRPPRPSGGFPGDSGFFSPVSSADSRARYPWPSRSPIFGSPNLQRRTRGAGWVRPD